MNKLLVILIAFAPLFAHADADLDQIKKDEEKCIEENMSQIGMKMCAAEAYHAADAVLNRDYKAMVAPLKSANDPDSREILKRLIAAQRAWVTFRDANCQYEGTWDLGGSNEGLDILGCLDDMTIARITELRGHN